MFYERNLGFFDVPFLNGTCLCGEADGTFISVIYCSYC